MPRASSTRVVPDAGSSEVIEWALKLAGSPPVIMRLGKGSAAPAADMPLRRREDSMRAQRRSRCRRRTSSEGVSAFLREARRPSEGRLMSTEEKTSILAPARQRISRARRAAIKSASGEEKIAAQHAREKLTAGRRMRC